MERAINSLEGLISQEASTLYSFILNEVQLSRMQQYYGILSKIFSSKSSDPDLLITINKKRKSVSFQHGIYRNYSNLSFEALNVEINSESNNEIDIPISMRDFCQGITNITSKNLTISIFADGKLGLEMTNNTYANCIIVNKFIQIYDPVKFAEELKFPEMNPKWKFEIKDSSIKILKQLLNMKRGKNDVIKFTFKKINSNKMRLELYNEKDRSSHVNTMPVSNKHDDYYQNQVKIQYDVCKLLNLFSLIQNNVKFLVFSFDIDCNLMIEEIKKDEIKIRGRFQTIEQD